MDNISSSYDTLRFCIIIYTNKSDGCSYKIIESIGSIIAWIFTLYVAKDTSGLHILSEN